MSGSSIFDKTMATRWTRSMETFFSFWQFGLGYLLFSQIFHYAAYFCSACILVVNWLRCFVFGVLLKIVRNLLTLSCLLYFLVNRLICDLSNLSFFPYSSQLFLIPALFRYIWSKITEPHWCGTWRSFCWTQLEGLSGLILFSFGSYIESFRDPSYFFSIRSRECGLRLTKILIGHIRLYVL